MMNSFFNYPNTPPIAPPQAITFWATRSQRDWRKLLNMMQTLRFRPNQTAIHANDKSDGFYLIGVGRFQADTPLTEGQAIGIASFFTGRPHSTDIVAQTDGELLYLSQAAFDIFAAREPELARAVLMELGRILAISDQA